MLIKVHNPSKKIKKSGVVKMKKKRRTPAQIRATKKLIAYNRAKRRKRNPAAVTKITKRKRGNPMALTKNIKRRPRRSTRPPITRYVYKYAYKKKRNPAGPNLLDLIQSSILAGIGGMGVLAISNLASKVIDLKTDKQKSLVRLITSLIFSYTVPMAGVKKEQADAIVSGGMAITWLSFIKTVLPPNAQNMFLLGADDISTRVDKLVDNIFGNYDPVMRVESPTLQLLGERELLGSRELGDYENQVSPERW